MPAQPSKVLETFPNPHSERDYLIAFDCPEFTCLCPRTGQPDFATIRIRYVPGELCVELKSLDHGSGPNFDLLLAQWHRQDRNRRQRQHKEP